MSKTEQSRETRGAIKQVYKAPVSGAALGQRLDCFCPMSVSAHRLGGRGDESVSESTGHSDRG